MNIPDSGPLEHYFAEELPDRFPTDECLDMLMVVIGERPGALVMGPSFKDRRVLEEFCNTFELSFLDMEGEKRSWLDRIFRRDTRVFRGGFFISREDERLGIIENSEGDFYGSSEKAVGEFLGYPKEDVEYYTEKRQQTPERNFRQKVEDFVEGNNLNLDLKYLNLASYVPKPEEENIRRAIRKGKEKEEKLLELEEETGSNISSKYLENLL